ncbi:MAG TPA: muconolactone Delta-isomerase family protein [Bacteroidota bacterium]
MNHYMVDIELPRQFTEEFADLIPSQRALVNTLMGEGKIASYSLSMDRSRLWVVVNAESAEHARGIIASFPIIAFIKFRVHDLMFHNSVRFLRPQFSLN